MLAQNKGKIPTYLSNSLLYNFLILTAFLWYSMKRPFAIWIGYQYCKLTCIGILLLVIILVISIVSEYQNYSTIQR